MGLGLGCLVYIVCVWLFVCVFLGPWFAFWHALDGLG